MIRILVFGLGAGAAIQAWRAWPPDSTVSANPLALVFCLGLVLAYLAGKRSGRPTNIAVATATATAEASSTATNSVQLAVFMPGHGAGSAPGIALPTDAAPWLAVPSSSVPELTADLLEGMDPEDLLERTEYDTNEA